MVAIGLVLFAVALGAGATLFMQNRGGGVVQVDVFGHTLTLQPYSIMVASDPAEGPGQSPAGPPTR